MIDLLDPPKPDQEYIFDLYYENEIAGKLIVKYAPKRQWYTADIFLSQKMHGKSWRVMRNRNYIQMMRNRIKNQDESPLDLVRVGLRELQITDAH